MRDADTQQRMTVLDRVARATAMAGLLGAALIHAMVVPEHLEEWRLAGFFFVALAAVEAILAVALARGTSRPLYLMVAIISVATLALWVMSRTAGMPLGPEPWVPEAVGRPDVMASVLEAITLLAVLPLMRADGKQRVLRAGSEV